MERRGTRNAFFTGFSCGRDCSSVHKRHTLYRSDDELFVAVPVDDALCLALTQASLGLRTREFKMPAMFREQIFFGGGGGGCSGRKGLNTNNTSEARG